MKDNTTKSERMAVRVTPQVKKEITDAARNSGMKLSEYITNLLVNPAPSIMTHENFISHCVDTNIIFNRLRAHSKLTKKDIEELEKEVTLYAATK